MSVRDKALDAKRLGLALSGGGYRAAAFHLGLMDVLDEEGILEKVSVLSTVSGGSIIGAIYCCEAVPYNQFRVKMWNILSRVSVLPGVWVSLLGRAAVLLPTLIAGPLMIGA